MTGWAYAPEFSTPSLALHYKQVAAGVVLSVVAQKRGGWRWFINQHARVIMHGDADTETGAKRLAEDALRQWWPSRPRTLFNPRYQSPVAGAMMLWINRYGSRVRGRDTYQDAIDIADELDLTTHQMLRLEIAMREFVEGRWIKPSIGRQRTLFNPRAFSKVMPHGKITVEGPVKSIVGKRYRWYVYIHMPDRHGKPGLYGPVASGLDATYRMAQDKALKAYLRFARPKPRMLFNPPRGHKLRLVFEKFKKAWEGEPAIFETEEEREDAIREAEELAHDIGDEHRMSLNNLHALFEMIPKYIVERERKEKQRRHPMLFNAGTR
jgi:hypothetical protein